MTSPQLRPSTDPYKPGDRVLAGGRRATVVGEIVDGLTSTLDDQRYDIRYDDGREDGQARHADMLYASDAATVQRLVARGWRGTGWGATAIIGDVSLAISAWLDGDRDLESWTVMPTRDDILDALALVRDARDDIDSIERRLLTAARDPDAPWNAGKPISWEAVGLVLSNPGGVTARYRPRLSQAAIAAARSLGEKRLKRLGGPWWKRPAAQPEEGTSDGQ